MRDRNSRRLGGFDYLRESFIMKRIPILERQKAETIFLETTIAKKKWFILFANHPPNFSKTRLLGNTQKMSVTLNKP